MAGGFCVGAQAAAALWVVACIAWVAPHGQLRAEDGEGLGDVVEDRGDVIRRLGIDHELGRYRHPLDAEAEFLRHSGWGRQVVYGNDPDARGIPNTNFDLSYLGRGRAFGCRWQWGSGLLVGGVEEEECRPATRHCGR